MGEIMARVICCLLVSVLVFVGSSSVAEAAAPAAAEAEASSSDIGWILGWTTIGLGLAAAATGGGYHLLADDPGAVPAILYVSGGFVALVGLYVLASSRSTTPADPATGAAPLTLAAPLVIAPWLGGGTSGVAVGGSF